MKKIAIIIGILAAGLVSSGSRLTVSAAGQSPPEKPAQTQTFHGKVEATDIAANTLTVNRQVIYTADTTKITRHGKPIILADIMVGEFVYGSTHQTFDGKTEALLIKVGVDEKGFLDVFSGIEGSNPSTEI